MVGETHPRLKKQLVTEALLEVRFAPPVIPYGIIPGILYEALKRYFPKAVELPAAQLPIGIMPDTFVRHRFQSEDEGRMYQIGVGVLSVNHIRYEGFDKFVADCRAVLEVVEQAGMITKIERLALRYINTAQLDRPWSEMIQIRVDAPEVILKDVRAQEFKWFTRFTDTGVLSTTIAWPIEGGGSPSLVIDLDHFYEVTNPMTIEQVLKWVHAAHENVYAVFQSSLTSQFFNELRGDE